MALHIRNREKKYSIPANPIELPRNHNRPDESHRPRRNSPRICTLVSRHRKNLRSLTDSEGPAPRPRRGRSPGPPVGWGLTPPPDPGDASPHKKRTVTLPGGCAPPDPAKLRRNSAQPSRRRRFVLAPPPKSALACRAYLIGPRLKGRRKYSNRIKPLGRRPPAG